MYKRLDMKTYEVKRMRRRILQHDKCPQCGSTKIVISAKDGTTVCCENKHKYRQYRFEDYTERNN